MLMVAIIRSTRKNADVSSNKIDKNKNADVSSNKIDQLIYFKISTWVRYL